jgi:hypothetical protein
MYRPLPRVNVDIDRFGVLQRLLRTIKVSSGRALRPILRAYRRANPLSNRQFNQLLRRLVKLYKKLGRVRELLTDLVGDLLGFLYAQQVRTCSRDARLFGPD